MVKNKTKASKLTQDEKNKIIKDLLPFITITARRLSYRLRYQSHLTIEDLISIGILGLLESIGRYDEEKASFKTYAEYRIKGAMLDALRSNYLMSRNSLKKLYKIKEVYKHLEATKGQTPEDIEVAQILNMSLDEYYEILERSDASVIYSLNIENGDEKKIQLIESICDKNVELIDEIIEKKMLIEKLAEKIKELNKKEQLVLSLYYDDELTMKEIGEVLNISESRVCQIHNQALIKLRVKLEK